MAGLRFALDEDVRHALAGILRSHGRDADSAKELGRLGLTDTQALVRAAEAGQTLITRNNKDFRALHEAWVTWRRRWEGEARRITGIPLSLSRYAGILIVPHLPTHDLARIVEEFKDAAEAMDDRLFAWNLTRGWHEIEPVG